MNTEEQAKNLHCPIGGERNQGNCVASQCAMWRWGTKGSLDGIALTRVGDYIIPGWTVHEPEKPRGYCGLAGRPVAVQS